MLLKEASVTYRRTRRPDIPRKPIRSSVGLAALVRPWFDGLPQEHMYVVLLDTKHRYEGHELISVGTLDGTMVHPRDVYRLAVMQNAGAVALTHNHPSGDPKPSREDELITKRFTRAGEILGIELLDHVIIGEGESYVSMRDDGLL